MYQGKNILVTGGTGSIGSEIVRQLLKYEPNVIRILSRDESKQFDLQYELKEYSNIRYLIGDIRDKDRINYATKDIDIIFHAAALKHVPSSEYNPFEAVKTNVFGVQNIIESAIDNNVEKVVAVSTDKVVNPTNTMGATKLLSEKLVSAAEHYKGSAKTAFSCVRFGNVMGSRGSVIPLFKKQIKQNNDITLTDKDMTRFMMSVPQAAKLVLNAGEFSTGGETYVLKMPVLFINDLAEVLIEDYNSKSQQSYTGKITEVGIRPGEKVYEELMTSEESERAFENDKMYAIDSLLNDRINTKQGFTKTDKKEYSSKTEKPLLKEEIKDLLKNTNLLF
ncbi:UDP-N-acetylglucosamine 4,6-dehydratase family protein [Gracilibacillus kekensis]|uniref:Polysaccharide biosynthesis protein n=1 Tax=Gracilibacillus kekensis TaxID=1027249 RepID=A0A1M7K7I8_9BACI|nr:UDP-N-acetylglucosamine 4,6-dehydratase family protein [Gracilibacillus kekensis]SHM61151.1 Polysaccharide biosynthesis protein [Gracilibacillus kekensis]